MLAPPPLSRGATRKAKKKQIQQQQAELERLDSLPWNPALSNDNDDPFSHLNGNNVELEGGFLMLEEIEDADYGLEIPEPEVENRNREEKSKPGKKSKKRKHGQADGSAADKVEVNGEERLDKDAKKMTKKEKKKKKLEEAQKNEDGDNNGGNEVEENDKDEHLSLNKETKKKKKKKKKKA